MIIAMVAAVDQPQQVISHALCRRCGASGANDPALRDAVLGKLKRDMLRDMRVLPIFAEPGTA